MNESADIGRSKLVLAGNLMPPYAQTNIQLFGQLRREGYSNIDLCVVRDAYELAMALFTSRFQPSGKSFIAHAVGTASILASLHLPGPVVAAGLIHNVYENGDFGDGHRGISQARRKKIKSVLGDEVETYVASFWDLHWKSQTTQLARSNPDRLTLGDRNVLLILLADHLEHLLDLDVLYYDDPTRRRYLNNSRLAAEIAERLGFCRLAEEFKDAVREAESGELPVEFLEPRKGSFVIAPKSCRKRLSAVLSESLINGTHACRRKFLKPVQLLYQRSSNLGKRAFRQ